MSDLERQIESALAFDGTRTLVRELTAFTSGADRLAHLDRRFPTLDQDSAQQLDAADDLILFHVLVQGWDDAISEVIAAFYAQRSVEILHVRERAFRLLGMPQPTLDDVLKNDAVSELAYASFDVAGIVNHGGVRHARVQRLDNAIRHFGSAIDICLLHPEPRINRGKAHLLAGRVEEGLRDYEIALLISGGDEEVRAVLKQHGHALGR